MPICSPSSEAEPPAGGTARPPGILSPDRQELPMADDLPPEDSKLTRAKRDWADSGKFLTGRIARQESERLPPGQHLVKNWPVLDLGRQPDIGLHRWKLATDGLVERPLTLDWDGFVALPQEERVNDIHCVTT